MENRLNIETAQNVIIEHNLAHLGERIVAFLIDTFVLIMWGMFCMFVGVVWEPSEGFGLWFLILLFGVPFTFYHLFMEVYYHGQSLGKMAMNIKVVRLDGREVTALNYFLRWLLRLVDISLFSGAIAIVVILAGGRGQRLGDVVAGTAVVSTRARTGLHDTYNPEVEDDYKVVFPEVALLTDEDVETIKEVMMFVQRNKTDHAISLAYKTKGALEEKMGISVEMKAKAFFDTILRDYTQYHTQLENDWEM